MSEKQKEVSPVALKRKLADGVQAIVKASHPTAQQFSDVLAVFEVMLNTYLTEPCKIVVMPANPFATKVPE